MDAIAEAFPVKVIHAVAAHTDSVRGNEPDREMAGRSHPL